MKYSYNWLKEMSETKESPKKLAESIMMHSFEVEEMEKFGSDLKGVVAGEILEIQKHPNADRLQLTKVNIGKEKLDIVCGAHNIKVGDKVPVALVGTKLPNGIEIKEAEIRGVKSFGMLCAEDELGLGPDHGGILILGSDAKIGSSVSDFLGLDDSIFEIKILADRGHDALSHLGMSREIASIEQRKLKLDLKDLKGAKKSKRLEVEIKDKNLCPRYIGAVMENIVVKESPAWAKSMLKRLGIRPINNIVDATNYVMLEFGQPLHAFDFDKISSMEIQNPKTEINIRNAKAGERIRLLEGSEKELNSDDIVIATEEKILALAGIMGGEDSGINESTTKIVLESANFNATAIRKTKTRLGLQTDAAYRFERGIDPNLAELAMARVIEIIGWFGGTLEGITDVYSKKLSSWKIKLDLNYANRLLGEEIPEKAVVKILNSMEIATTIRPHKVEKILECVIPTFRLDLKTQEDLIEEIGRIYGYEKIKSKAILAPVQPAPVNEKRAFERRVKNILVGQEFSEVYNYSFYSQHDAGLCQLSTVKHLELENPGNPDQALMRVSLIPMILKNVNGNLKNFKDFKLFEIGRVYWQDGSVLPEERTMLVGASVLDKDAGAETFRAVKGQVDAMLNKLGVPEHYYNAIDPSPIDTFSTLWHQGRSAEIKIKGSDSLAGYLGEINPLILSEFDIHKRVAMFEFNLDVLRNLISKKEFKHFRKFPIVTRDISMLAHKQIRVKDIIDLIKSSGGELILQTQLFDIFEKDNKKSYAFHIQFGSDRTLESKEVDSAMENIIFDLESKLGLEIRK